MMLHIGILSTSVCGDVTTFSALEHTQMYFQEVSITYYCSNPLSLDDAIGIWEYTLEANMHVLNMFRETLINVLS
jgi:hypothetical protein